MLALAKNKLASFIALAVVLFIHITAAAQCPQNIDFEQGTFAGWQCYIGLFSPGNISLLPSAPVTNRHVIYSAEEANGNDYWGDFPKVCPNGSDYSVRLGNDSAGRNAERLSYTFTIPPDQYNFNLVYNYAVVLQDPGHPADQQPRLSIEVFNVTDNEIDACSSFDFVSTGSLAGFKDSPRSGNSPVKYKDWSSAFINLSGKAGKTFRISFTTTDCSEAAHFGYAYIDMYTLDGCNNTVPTSLFCKDDKFVDLKAPPGFQSYKWFNTSGTVVGTDQILHISPAPRSGDTLFVEVIPFSGYGCPSILAVYLKDTLTIHANAGKDREFCFSPARTRLGAPPKGSEVYTWSPSIGLSKPDVANPWVSPTETIDYRLTVKNYAGGCLSTDKVRLIKKCDPIDIYVPSGFTPDDNGLNDRLKPVLYGYKKLNYFRVFDRYGQQLFAAFGDTNGWDGTFKGKKLPPQVVVWIAEGVNVYGITEIKRGTSVIIR